MTKFISEVHEFKEDSISNLVRLMDSKIIAERKKLDEKILSVQSSTSTLLTTQEASMASLKSRIAQLDDEMDKLLAE